MAYVITYPGMLGPVCRAFATRERAEQWAHQAGVSGRSTLHESDCIRFYRCRAYRGKLQLFPAAESVSCGHFINGRHFEQLLKLWTGRAGGPDDVRYEYSVSNEDCADAATILDHRRHRPEFARPEFTVA